MLFSRDKDENEKQKRRSMLGMLFRPDFGSDIRPIGETFRMFVNLIAMVFATSGLFPKNHPALTGELPLNDPRARLTLPYVIRVAFNQLEFTKKGLPKVLFFVAVVGCLGMGVLMVAGILMSLFTGQAHAQSMFIPPDKANDWGWSWIDYIFLGKSISVAGVEAPPEACTWQRGLGLALGYYSRAVLVIAGVILMYRLTAMVAETAHSGRVMGKANQIWAPIRLVVAIGLLVPIASTSSNVTGCSIGTVTGLNSGQYIVVQLTKWGSGLASNVWKTFLDRLSQEQSSEACPEGSPSCVEIPASVRNLALAMISNYACKEMYDYYAKQTNSPDSDIDLAEAGGFGPSDFWIGNKSESRQHYCGGYQFSEIPNNTPYTAVYEAQIEVFNNYLSTFQELAKEHYKYFVTGPGGTSGTAEEPSNKLINDALEEFQKALNEAIEAPLRTADKAAMDSYNDPSNNMVLEGGWLGAGAWFNTIARLQSLRSGSVWAALPSIRPAEVLQDPENVKPKTKGEISSPDQSTATSLQLFNKWIKYAGDSPVPAATAGTQDMSAWKKFISRGNPIEILFSIVDWGMTAFNIWTEDGYLAVKFDSRRNPLAELAAFGQSMMSTSTWLFSLAGVFYIANTVLSEGADSWAFKTFSTIFTFGLGDAVAGSFAAVASLVASALMIVGTVLFGAGLTVGFLMPLIPFFRFFFGSLSWVLSVFESVVAIPMFALAHLNPEGEGLPGQQARAGYFFILYVMLRPVLMIFGLIAGFLLFSVAIVFLNTLFVAATAGTGAYAGVFPTLSKFIFSVLYCALAYICGNMCFKSIGMFPLHAMSWLGGGHHHEQIGDPGTLSAAAGAVQAYFVSKGMGQLLQAPGAVLKGFKPPERGNKSQIAAFHGTPPAAPVVPLPGSTGPASSSGGGGSPAPGVGGGTASLPPGTLSGSMPGSGYVHFPAEAMMGFMSGTGYGGGGTGPHDGGGDISQQMPSSQQPQQSGSSPSGMSPEMMVLMARVQQDAQSKLQAWRNTHGRADEAGLNETQRSQRLQGERDIINHEVMKNATEYKNLGGDTSAAQVRLQQILLNSN